MVDAIAPAGALAVSIPAPDHSARDFFIARSAKGEQRTDAAAPPTVAAGGEGSFSFGDFLDIVNPLQHIPGVNLAYRAITGDKISTASNVAGGALFGGGLGGIAALAMSMIDELSAASAAPAAVAQNDADNPARPDIFRLG